MSVDTPVLSDWKLSGIATDDEDDEEEDDGLDDVGESDESEYTCDAVDTVHVVSLDSVSYRYNCCEDAVRGTVSSVVKDVYASVMPAGDRTEDTEDEDQRLVKLLL